MAELKSRLTLKMESLRAVQQQKSASSEPMEIGGFFWRMEVHKTEAKQTDPSDIALDLSIHCNESKMDSLWLCHAQFVLRIRQVDKVTRWPSSQYLVPYEQIFFNGNYVWNGPANMFSGRYRSVEEMIIVEFELVRLQQSTMGKNMPALDTNLHISFDGKNEIVVVNSNFKSHLGLWKVLGRKDDDEFARQIVGLNKELAKLQDERRGRIIKQT